MNIDSQASPYYPPRAHWYSSLWRLWYPVKRRLHLDRVPKIARHELSRILLGILLPGWALCWSKRPILGVILGAIYCLSAAVFLIWIGHPASNFALTVMMTIHAGGILRLERSVGLWNRLAYSLLIFLAVAGGVYVPLRNRMEQHWFAPLQIGDRLVVIRTGVHRDSVKRGDWIAYRAQRITITGLGAIRTFDLHGTATLGQVLAVAGDEVVFHPDTVSINGESRPRQSRMPTDGIIHVERGHWFVWPELSISGEGNVEPALLRQSLLLMADVSEQGFVGVPYQRWFWRKQTVR